jgi:putative thioredoxin
MDTDNIIDVTDSNFDVLVLEYSYKIPVIVDFWADWCKPCKILGPLLEKLTKEAEGSLRLAKVDVDNNQNLAIRFGIHSIPSVKSIKDGKVIAEFVGSQSEPKLREFIKLIAPTKYDLTLEKGQSLLQSQKWDQASEVFQEVLTIDPQNPKALLGIAKCLIANNKASDAYPILTKFPASREYHAAELLIPLCQALTVNPSITINIGDPLIATYENSLRLFTRGNYFAAIDGFLDILREDKQYKADKVRQVLVGIFELFGDDNNLIREYRQELASILF